MLKLPCSYHLIYCIFHKIVVIASTETLMKKFGYLGQRTEHYGTLLESLFKDNGNEHPLYLVILKIMKSHTHTVIPHEIHFYVSFPCLKSIIHLLNEHFS